MKDSYGRDFGTSPQLYKASPGWFNDDFVEKGDQDSVVGTATPYGVDVSRLEPRRRRVLTKPFKPAVGYTLIAVKLAPFLLLEIKRVGRSLDNPPPSSAKVKE